MHKSFMSTSERDQSGFKWAQILKFIIPCPTYQKSRARVLSASVTLIGTVGSQRFFGRTFRWRFTDPAGEGIPWRTPFGFRIRPLHTSAALNSSQEHFVVMPTAHGS